MHIKAETLDDLLRETFERILKDGERVRPTRGPNKELFGVVLELTKPRARVSRTDTKGKFFSALGELLWYLAGSDEIEFVQYYLPTKGYESEDGKTVWGAYGPRLFRMRGSIDQLAQVRKLLSEHPSSRRAVVQLFNAEDISSPHKDVPCTCTLQLLVRSGSLDMFVSMRSNDAYRGLPHDIFAFTMLQEILACELGLKLGRYKHAAGSLHIYDDDVSSAQEFIAEAWQDVLEMPPMPHGNPWPAIESLKRAEADIRNGREINIKTMGLDDYWSDLVRLLQILATARRPNEAESSAKLTELEATMSSQFYKPYIRDRLKVGR